MKQQPRTSKTAAKGRKPAGAPVAAARASAKRSGTAKTSGITKAKPAPKTTPSASVKTTAKPAARAAAKAAVKAVAKAPSKTTAKPAAKAAATPAAKAKAAQPAAPQTEALTPSPKTESPKPESPNPESAKPEGKVLDAKAAASSQKQLEDKQLVQRARAGDQLAFNDLIKRHRHGVERLIRPMVRSAPTDELEDLVQEALTKAMLHLNSYSEEYAFSTWLYRIATNHAIDYLRRRKLNAFSISAPAPNTGSKQDDDGREYEISDDSWVPDEVMLADERTALIERAIEQLPENYKRIIRLRHNDDLEYEEIARVLQLPMGTVKVHLHRARAALARMLRGKI